MQGFCDLPAYVMHGAKMFHHVSFCLDKQRTVALLTIISVLEQNFSENAHQFEEVQHEYQHHRQPVVPGQPVPDLCPVRSHPWRAFWGSE